MSTYVSNRDGGKTNEEGHYKFPTNVWSGNISGDSTSLQVKQNSPLGMSVLVSAGDLKIDYSDYAYTGWNDADAAVTITTADGSNPRIDRIVAYIDRGATPQTVNPNNPGMLVFAAVAGTPASSPSAPSDSAVNTAVGASNPWCELAQVAVAAGATTLSNSVITDKRSFIKIGSSNIDWATIGSRQDDTTNTSYGAGLKVYSGWGVIAISNGTTTYNETVTFPAAFTNKPIVIVAPGGDNTTNSGYGSGDNIISGSWTAKAVSITNSTFKSYLISTAVGANGYVWYQWIAVGV
jgi:hypothetical protein